MKIMLGESMVIDPQPTSYWLLTRAPDRIGDQCLIRLHTWPAHAAIRCTLLADKSGRRWLVADRVEKIVKPPR